MRTTAIINLKGGVGKTTTAINLAYQLYEMGKSVLLIDLDKQGNTSKFFNIDSRKKDSITDVLMGDAEISECISKVHDSENGCLHVVPADISLEVANRQMIIDSKNVQQTRLKDALDHIDGYDYCIIDCAPSIDLVVLNAMTASDDIVINTTLDWFALEGIVNILDNVDSIQKSINPSITVAGCLVTMYRDTKENHDKNIEITNQLNALMEHYCGTDRKMIYDSKIKWSKQVTYANYDGMTLDEYAPKCAAARCYRNFAKEYLGEV